MHCMYGKVILVMVVAFGDVRINAEVLDICESCLCDCVDDVANCQNRNIANVNGTLLIPGYISRIDFSDNEISNLEDLDVRQSKSLEFVDLSSNAIQALIPTSFRKFNGSIKSVSLKNNIIQDIHKQAFTNMTSLEKLTLSFNKITELEDSVFDDLPNLRILDLSYNPIGHLRESTLMNLRSLEELNLSSIHLEKMSSAVFDWNLTISYLDLSENFFTSVPSKSLWYLRKTLKTLKLSGNFFEVLPAGSFFGLEFLEELKLEQLLYLKQIEAFAFKDLRSFEDITLRYLPKFHTIDEKAFHLSESSDNTELCPIRDLTIEFTTLSSLGESLLDWEGLRYASLRSNRFVCDCSMKWIKQSPLENLTHNSIYCLGNGPNKGRNTCYLSEEDFTCTTFVILSKSGALAIFLILVLALVLSLSTVTILVYRRNGWVLRPPRTNYDKIDSSLNTITIFDRASIISTQSENKPREMVNIRNH